MKRLLVWSVLPWLAAQAGRFDPDAVKPLPSPPEEVLSPAELVRRQGYAAQEYSAQTEDGYILRLTRILARPGPPVLMVNGLVMGPDHWVLHGPGHDLAFVLSDLGYDVWLGGQRGLLGSEGHVSLNISQPEYWDFSHDESGYYDLPAMIDVITAESGYSRLFYVGTSLGGTLFMAMCAERPDYCSAVAGNVLFGPALYMPQWSELHPLTRFNIDVLKFVLFLMDEASVYHTPLRPAAYVSFMRKFCDSTLGEQIFFMILKFIIGFNRENMAKGWLGYTLSMSFEGTSTRQVKHLMVQLTRDGGTKKYDWGPTKNLQKYGRPTPPSYDLSKITSPTLLYYSKTDRLISYQAMEKAIQQMGNIKIAKPVLDPTFGHAEFVFSKNLYKFFYSEIVDFFDSISGLNSTLIHI